MTNETGQGFNERADAAMRGLKDQLGIQHSPVPNGQPTQAQPPVGSYAEMALEEQKRVAATRAEVSPPQSVPGEVAPPSGDAPQPVTEVGPDGKPIPFTEHPLYPRFQQVTAERREAKEQLAQLERAQAASDLEKKELREQFEALQVQHRTMLEANIENLEPDERNRVLMEGRFRQLEDRFAQRVEERVRPALSLLRTQMKQREIDALAVKYPRYDGPRHQELIDLFQESNPASTVEMAFKATAEPEDLAVNGQSATPSPPPPVVVPGVASTGTPRYVPPGSQESEDAQLRAGAARVRELATSADPRDRSNAINAAQASIATRIMRP